MKDKKYAGRVRSNLTGLSFPGPNSEAVLKWHKNIKIAEYDSVEYLSQCEDHNFTPEIVISMNGKTFPR